MLHTGVEQRKPLIRDNEDARHSRKLARCADVHEHGAVQGSHWARAPCSLDARDLEWHTVCRAHIHAGLFEASAQSLG